MTASKNELAALSLVKQIQQCYEMTFVKADEAINWAIRCGEFLSQSKSLLGHGAFGGFVSQHFEFSQRHAQRFMKLYKDLHQIPNATRLSLLKSAGSIDSLQKLLSNTSSDSTSAGAEPASAPGHAESRKSSKPPPQSDAQIAPYPPNGGGSGKDGRTDADGTEPQETTPTPPRNGKAKRGGSPPKQLDRRAYYKQWDNAIGPLVRLVDKIAQGVGESNNGHHRDMQEHLNDATDCMMEWMDIT